MNGFNYDPVVRKRLLLITLLCVAINVAEAQQSDVERMYNALVQGYDSAYSQSIPHEVIAARFLILDHLLTLYGGDVYIIQRGEDVVNSQYYYTVNGEWFDLNRRLKLRTAPDRSRLTRFTEDAYYIILIVRQWLEGAE